MWDWFWFWFWQAGGWQPSLLTALAVTGIAATIAGVVKTALRWRTRRSAPALLTDGEMELLADLRGHPDAALVRGEVLESEEASE